MTRSTKVHLLTISLFILFSLGHQQTGMAAAHEIAKQGAYTGTSSCRPCHEKFYQLWAPSWHGLAMQEMSEEVAAQPWMEGAMVTVNNEQYAMRSDGMKAWVEAASTQKTYPVSQILGGKNVYYFLTPFERGRLQVLPVAYDVNRQEWFDTAASGVRHFQEGTDEALHWTDRSFAFNTTCYSCHVSQLSHNYDVTTDTYTTVWNEPGINCETCHGPGEKHIEVCEQSPQGTVPDDLMIIRGGRDFTADQNNANCVQCHAKAIPVSTGFQPGDTFSDHFTLVTLESHDYYPDGRDLGENYTHTSWLMSPCVASGDLDCLHCHTSSGRFKQKDTPNTSCLPCHKARVDNATAHTMHEDGPDTPTCVSCHMPMTEFARMKRSDHSMRPPTPATTLEFGTPNACNICHDDKSAQWADATVRQWRKRDYQKSVLERARLIDAARKGDWSKVDELFALLESDDLDVITSASLLRLLRGSNDPRRWSTAQDKLNAPSPIVRAAAVAALEGNAAEHILHSLVTACNDPSRTVRIEAASILAQFRLDSAAQTLKAEIAPALNEYLATFSRRPDLWTSHYNIGTYYMRQGAPQQAIESFNIASALEPNSPIPLINAALAHSMGKAPDKALAKLLKAESLSPDSLPVQFNLGLIYAELNQPGDAMEHLQKAYAIAPDSAQVAYNLGLLTIGNDKKKGLELLKRAVELDPDNPKYEAGYDYYK